MATDQQYPTRPLECWEKAEELRRFHGRHVWEVQKKGGLLIHGMADFQGVLAGMGDFAQTEFTPHFGALMKDPREAIKCHEATEARGFSHDLCSSMRCHLGAMFLGFGFTSIQGERLRPDLVLQSVPCNSLPKTSQLYSEYWGLPSFTVDIPWKESPATFKYLADQLRELIEWMEKVTGKKYDDERLLQGVRNEWRCLALFARVLDLNRAVPAPLDLRHIFPLQIPALLQPHRDEVVAFYGELLAEVEERVKDGISARGHETRRIMHGGFTPMYYMDILRYPAQFGAIYVTSDLAWRNGAWTTMSSEDGGWKPAPLTPEEAGFSLRTRGDALRLIAELSIHYRTPTCPVEAMPGHYTGLVQGWKADAAIIHIDRGCKGRHASILEARLALQENGVPTLVYEGSGYDPRDFNEAQVLDRMDTFMESLGLARR